ncbi:MAG TPA: hypothetical protein VJ878_04665 [Candidatus Izemoplasmatales bacterium]|nr:hypothetical protein [Candidatus Izemoplasmatales bacterium]
MTYKSIKTKLYVNKNEKKFLLYLKHEAKNLTKKNLSRSEIESLTFKIDTLKFIIDKGIIEFTINVDLNASLNMIS